MPSTFDRLAHGNRLPDTCLFFLLAIASVSTCDVALATGIATIGPEHRAPLATRPPFGWPSCTTPSGGRVQLKLVEAGPGVRDDSGLIDDDTVPGAVEVILTDAAGALVTEPFRANVEPTSAYNDYALTASCLAEGRFVVTWQRMLSRGGEIAARVFDTGGHAKSGEIVLPQSHKAPWNSLTQVAAALADDTSLWLAHDTVADYDAMTALAITRLDTVTAAASAPLVIPGSSYDYFTIAAQDDQVAFAWLEREPNGSSRDRTVHAAIAIPDAGYVSGVTQVSTFPRGYPDDLTVLAAPGGRFEVTWSNGEQGGRVGRTIALAAMIQTTTTTTTTTTTLDESAMRFPNQVVIDAYSNSRWVHYGGRQLLGADTQGTWLATWVAAKRLAPDEHWYQQEYVDTYARSTDEGLHWVLGPPIRHGDDLLNAFDVRVTGDGTGHWLQTWRAWGGEGFVIAGARSDDGGNTWSAADLFYAPSLPGDEAVGGVAFVEVGATAPGSWIIAVADTWGYGYGDTAVQTAALRLLRSTDAGRVWSVASEHALDANLNLDAEGALAVSGDSAFIVWAQGDVLWISTASDAGSTWSVPRKMLGDDTSSYGSVHSLDAGLDANGVGVVTWRAQGLFGEDGDIVYARSTDAGHTWSEPAPIADYVADDDAEDAQPAVAVDAQGTWLVTWASHHDGGRRWGMDGDILFTSSSDSGVSWTLPRLLVESFRTDEVRDRTARLATSYPGVFGIAWSREITDVAPADVAIMFASSNVNCGNSSLDPGEQCDDGNDVEGDGCDTNCRESGCGNSITDPSEGCDDANSDDTDECLSTCVAASCGDGFVQVGVEQCDDGNTSSTDGCTAKCVPSKCGDGILWNGREECDDGNSNRFDGCLPTCKVARCGDGVVWIGVEECDDGNSVDDDSCSNDCIFSAECMDLRSQPVATDARMVLTYAVGATETCALETCDLNSDGVSTASDASLVLRQAVGLEPWGECNGTEMVVRLLTPVALGALQLTVHYDQAFHSIPKRADGRPDCDVLAGANLYVSFFDSGSELRMGLISAHGFTGPADLFACRTQGGVFGPADIRIEVVDVTAPDLSPVRWVDLVAFGR